MRMASRHFTTLRKHRKRHTLLQVDVAYLLGDMCGTKICRYEAAERLPSLRTALALSVVLDAPLFELFPDLHAHLKEDIKHRAYQLLRQMDAAQISDGPKRRRLKAMLED